MSWQILRWKIKHLHEGPDILNNKFSSRILNSSIYKIEKHWKKTGNILEISSTFRRLYPTNMFYVKT